MTSNTLQELVDTFIDDHTHAPQYKTYSQTMRKNLKTKSQVQTEFISNLQMLKCVTDDPKIEAKIDSILKKFE